MKLPKVGQFVYASRGNCSEPMRGRVKYIDNLYVLIYWKREPTGKYNVPGLISISTLRELQVEIGRPTGYNKLEDHE